jgi:hypothetical protein
MKIFKSFVSAYIQIINYFFVIASTFLVLIYALHYSKFGIDLTDEGYYLNSISNPDAYDSTISQFGFIYSPIYKLVQGNIMYLRQMNIFIIFVLSWILCYKLLKYFFSDFKSKNFIYHIMASGLAVSSFHSLAFFGGWLHGPSYNYLLFKALLLVAIGLIITLDEKHLTAQAGWALIGFGTWLSFMAKPTSALILITILFVYIFVIKNLYLRKIYLLISGFVLPILLSALSIDGSVDIFVERYKNGYGYAQLFANEYRISNIIRIDTHPISDQLIAIIIFFSLFTFLWLWFMKFQSTIKSILSLFLSTFFFGIVLIFSSNKFLTDFNLGRVQSIISFGTIIAVIVFATITKDNSKSKPTSKEEFGIAFIFTTMPYIFAVGTGNNYVGQSLLVTIFWILASLIYLRLLSRHKSTITLIIPIVLGAQAITAIILNQAMQNPYRQSGPMILNNSKIEVGKPGSELILNVDLAEYIINVISKANKSGFTPGTPIIDLSGLSPTILYALNAESIGQAWQLGNVDLITGYLQRVTCEKIAAAWILHEPTGPNSDLVNVVSNFGLSLESDYVQVASWVTPETGFNLAPPRIQFLSVPKTYMSNLRKCENNRIFESTQL